MRSANPALNKNTFAHISHHPHERMTLNGTVNKTMILLILLLFTASLTWGSTLGIMLIFPAAIIGLIVAIITVFKREWSPVTAPIYALVEGAMLGALSSFFEAMFPGIVIQAVLLTFGILFSLLFAYKSRLIKPTENFKLGIVAATGGIALVYIISMVLGFFGTQIPLIHGSGWVGIGFSVFVVIIASLNLVLDFDFIEDGAEKGAPKYMEWYASFGLMVTLIWLYIEILHLLSKLRSRN
ncbi:Bax inhibitor-1/YccA family protein [Nanoarchaeota archaeon]